jgi:hypothetical protein
MMPAQTFISFAQYPGLDRALGILAAPEDGGGDDPRRIIATTLAGTPDEATEAGLLNRTGGPVEFSFSTLSEELRYSLELGTDGTPPAARLARLDHLVRGFGYGGRPSAIDRSLAEMQAGTKLEWGAWLGVRHAPTGPVFKKYAEVPGGYGDELEKLLARYLPAATDHLRQLATPVMVGHKLGSDRCECYFELGAEAPAVADLKRLLALVGLESRLDALTELVAAFDFRRPGNGEGPLPAGQWGVSFSTEEGGAKPAVSLFVMATDLLGGDGFVRRAFALNARARGWSTGQYVEFSQPLETWALRSAHHNMLAFVVMPNHLGMQLGISPPFV